jgi:glycosyltransferase involved in cell wall biosynthesis
MTRRAVMILSNALSSDPRVEKEASALAAAGWGVTVLAWDRAGTLPASEDRDGWRVERLGPRARHGAGLRSLPLYREFWSAVAVRAAALAPDVVHCHDLDTAPAGMSAVRAIGDRARLVLDMHELYRESNMLPQGGSGALARWAVRRLELRAYAAAHAIVVANPGTTGYYGSLGAGEKVVLVENAPDTDVFVPRAGARPERPFTVGFMGQKRYPGQLVDLIEAVGRTDGVAALLAGGGTAEAEVAAAAARVPAVEVSGAFAYADLPALYERCDAIHAVYDARLGNVRTLFPVKMMESMACALPVIVAKGTWAGDYAVEHGVGIAVPAGDVDALAATLVALRDGPESAAEMGRRGRALIESGLDWRSSARRLTSLYARLAD